MTAQLATSPLSISRQKTAAVRRTPGPIRPGTLRLSFSTAPTLLAGMFFAAGIIIARFHWMGSGVLLCAILLTLLLCVAALRGAPRMAALALAVIWLLLGAFAAEMQPTPVPHTALLALADGSHAVIQGEITRTTSIKQVQSPIPFSTATRDEHTESIDVRLESAGFEGEALDPVRGGLRATIYSPLAQPFPVLHCGDHIQATIAMHAPERYLDPGVWDATAWLRQQGVDVVGATSAASMTVTRATGRPTLSCWLHSLQQSGSERLLAFAADTEAQGRIPAWLRISREDAGMLSAIVLGDRSYLQREARAGFERTGSFHLLVVSGLHLAIFAGVIFSLARHLRLHNEFGTALTILCSFGYALLTGFGQPVQRSFWMVTLFLLARLLSRERNSLNGLGFAALCLLAWDPASLFGASFQMTLLSVVVLAGIVLPIAEHTFAPYLSATRNLSLIALDPVLPPKVAQFRVTLRLIASHLKPLTGARVARHLLPVTLRLLLRGVELAVASTLIELAMALPMAVYFHRVTALALPVNVLVLPLIGLALPAALLTFSALLTSHSLAMVPAAATGALLHSITAIVRHFGGMGRGDIRIATPSAVAIAAGVGCIGLALWAARNSRFRIALPIAALCCGAVIAIYPRAMVFRPGVLEVTAIDVGQGDSLLLVSPQGKTLLIDAGGPIGGAGAPATNFEIGEDVVSPVLWSRNIRRLDAVALTHAHSDHMGGMAAVLRNFHPQELWVGNNPETPAYAALLADAASLGIRVRRFAAGDAFDFGGTKIEVLAPERDYLPGAAASNNDSLVLHAQFGDTSALLEGDAEAPSERVMLDDFLPRHGEELHADLLKVGHHGSKTSTTPSFLAAVHPGFAVISVGRRNPYGHPRFDVLERLQSAQIHTYRTDALGATSFYLDGHAVAARPLAMR